MSEYCFADDWKRIHLRASPAGEPLVRKMRERPVPRLVHQVWLGTEPIPPHVERWREYCERHDIQHELWTERRLRAAKLTNASLFERFGDVSRYERPYCWQAQSDLARYEILLRYRGLYADCDIVPADTDVDITDHLPMTGFSVTTEHVPRHLETGALFAANGFIASSPGHPILERVVASAPLNVESFEAAGIHDLVWMVGPFLLNKCLHGVFHLIHRDLVMVDPPRDHFHLVEFAKT